MSTSFEIPRTAAAPAVVRPYHGNMIQGRFAHSPTSTATRLRRSAKAAAMPMRI
jgi:hypothetical protein